jgi:hypothetical protein
MKETYVSRLLCGACAGAVACFTCYPLDLIRTRLIADRSGYYLSFSQTTSVILRDEGLRGFYRGLMPSLVVTMPTLAMNYSIYGTFKAYCIENKIGVMYVVDTQQFTAAGAVCSGALAGMLTSLVVFPVDLVRKRRQISNNIIVNNAGYKSGLFTQLRLIMRYVWCIRM